MEMYQTAGPSEPIIHVYDVPTLASHYEEIMNIQDEASGSNQQSDNNEDSKVNSNDSDGYEMPHEYIEVL
ncbi:Hypothetical predicted protein [Mytilus galloprovincialis]|uniref:Uncharacterized protein n=1 Tax=Mytilus galloprovincialis TaxID=29158 RepID=A0A8B6GM01_MYTGA|nr:Hypothetical predicted protein [Mytilus galloprovincialis]